MELAQHAGHRHPQSVQRVLPPMGSSWWMRQMKNDGQAASLRLIFPNYGKLESSEPTRSFVGPSGDQSSQVLRCYAEERHGNISSFLGERR